ncbi:MAG: alpha-amylase [Firmicutes bacterium]|nr:alpha-amylase [Bacillota bacterium]
MALDTKKSLRNLVIYSVYVRNHTKEGTFRAVIPDLPRIKDLGTDVVWLMPIHPIGEKARKGTLGSPYANKDYRSVNPEYGTLEDFKALVDAIHENGMKCIIDVVYNHTSPDSVLWETHPEFFYRKKDGRPGNHVGDWTDIIDLDYRVPELWDYQTESLKFWAGYVDGFRCDVASFVPVEFWKKARAEVERVRPGCIWLAESIHMSFNNEMRRRGMYAARDIDLFEAFDMEYEYDVRETFEKFLKGEAPLSSYTELLNFQEFCYPDNYIKTRFLENHDLPRIASLIKDPQLLENYTAMLYFLKGSTLLYAGQELCADHLPGLFDKDPVDWGGGPDISPLLTKLGRIKKEYLSSGDGFLAKADDGSGTAVMYRWDGERGKAGIFPLRGSRASVRTDIPDGVYKDLISGENVTIKNGTVNCIGKALILCYNFSDTF